MPSIKSAHPLGKFTSQRLPEDVPEKHRDVLRTSPYTPLCNTKGRILSGASLGRTQDDNLTIIHKIAFYRIFFIFCNSVILILYQALYSQRRLKTWYALFWSYYGLRRLNQNRTIMGTSFGRCVMCDALRDGNLSRWNHYIDSSCTLR